MARRETTAGQPAAEATRRATLCEAIASRSLVTLVYDGGRRTVEPYIYGLNTRGHEVLSAYQVAGESASGEAGGWKSFRLDRVMAVETTGVTFARNRPDYHPGDPRFAAIHCRA